jgi:hypothetical protein
MAKKTRVQHLLLRLLLVELAKGERTSRELAEITGYSKNTINQYLACWSRRPNNLVYRSGYQRTAGCVAAKWSLGFCMYDVLRPTYDKRERDRQRARARRAKAEDAMWIPRAARKDLKEQAHA